MLQSGPCGVAKTDAADHYIQPQRVQSGQSQIGEGHFNLMKKVRHEEGVSELDLVNSQIIPGRHAPATERQLANEEALGQACALQRERPNIEPKLTEFVRWLSSRKISVEAPMQVHLKLT